MCMIDDSDERAQVLSERHYVACIAHKCSECERTIKPSERYMVERFIYDGAAHTHKTCAHCERVREWLTSECGGFLYDGVREDIMEHASEGYGLHVKMMAVGVLRQWTRKDGKLWRIPRFPAK